MTLPRVIDANGRSFPLDRQLAAGGEGAVYLISNAPHHVAKVYHKPPTAQTVEKLTVMAALANPRLLDLAAWPSSLLRFDSGKQVAGFVMPRLVDCQPIQHLYNPVMRLKSFPRASWTFQIRTAANLAAAFDEVHKAGCLVGDVNQSNAQVSPQALVKLIDCDSFQVRANGKQFLCEVGTPHYTPPELQGQNLRGVPRTENHDRFGLAVLIFQLLFVGRHPYAGIFRGKGDPSFEQLIAEYRFAQGPMAHMWEMGPPPHTPTFADIPPDIGQLFRRAFERGSQSGTRPRPAEWLPALKSLEQNAVECPADPGHKFWKGAGGCVWCRLAAKGGPEYYFGVANDSGTFVVDESRLQEVLRRLALARVVALQYDRSRYESAELPAPEEIPDGVEEHRDIERVVKIAGGLCLLTIPLGFYRGAFAFFGLLSGIVFGIWLAILKTKTPWQREVQRRRAMSNECLRGVEAIEDQWFDRVQRYQREHHNLTRSIQELVTECRELSWQHQNELKRLTADAEYQARYRYLRLHLISDAYIPSIGAGRKQTLAANGVFTAADINENVIREIHGFGDVLTYCLLAWKDDVLQKFRFNPATAASPGEQRALVVRFRTKQSQLFAEADRLLQQLELLTPQCKESLQALAIRIKKAVQDYEQAESDLRLMTHRR